ncbi:hypothetical protein [Micromonospora chersina]|uniref:hypothetical protein n=1 Tax=Micromonospora chersina TaxID=47854 RepID=UPI00340AE26D
MPQVTDNEDGTKTFSINSAEVRAVRDRLVERVPEVKKVLQLVDSPDVRATLSFLRSAVL